MSRGLDRLVLYAIKAHSPGAAALEEAHPDRLVRDRPCLRRLFLFMQRKPLPHDLSVSRQTIVEELVAVLTPHPKGLRRWSVMRAIRKSREAVSREIPLKMEADVERTFRQFCRGDGMHASKTALFYCPAEKAGEVWALALGSEEKRE